MTRRTVGHVMTRDVVTVRPQTPYKEIALALAEHRISGAPVIDAEDRVLGVVSEADLLAREQHHGERMRRVALTRRSWISRRKAVADVAEALMTAPPVTAAPDMSITQAARLMDANHVKRLPVVDEAGRIVGIVSRRDLLRVFLRPDDEIRAEIIGVVFERSLWVNPVAVNVSVADGVVTLEGTLERKSFATLAVELVRRVDGVVTVVDRLQYEFDDTRVSPGVEEYWRQRIG